MQKKKEALVWLYISNIFFYNSEDKKNIEALIECHQSTKQFSSN
jgi:hypothetical protein